VISRAEENAWQHEVVAAGREANDRVVRLVATAHRSEAQSFLRLQNESGLRGPLLALYHAWQYRPQALLSADCRDLLNEALAGRYMVLKLPEWTRGLQICDVGRGYLSFDDPWLSKAIGRRFADQPDKQYAQWAAQAYYEVGSSEQPTIDDCDVLVGGSNRGARRVQYRRLILPLRSPKGDHFMLSASVLDRSIDLRIKGKSKILKVV
jgi:hypothetical protein